LIPTQEAAFLIGQTISHYRILEALGGGGMGIVYKALDTRLQRQVALKFLPPELAHNADAKHRLLDEATSLSSLQHKNICVVHDIDETEDGQLFIAMELLEGETLQKRLESGPLPLERALHIAIEVAQGLAKAHQCRMTHRDVKPANIIILKDGTVKILDFGIAGIMNSEAHAKEAEVSGTAAYMSPEQVVGAHTDGRTDIWSLGVVLYEMVTGKPPFAGQYYHAAVYQILHERHQPPSRLRKGLPSALESVIDRCLEKKPDDRYESMESLLEELQRASSAARKPLKVPDKSIAVLPFSDISQDKDNAYFTDGLTEEIVARLSKLRNLRILPLPSVSSYDRSGKPMRQIGTDLGVQFLLLGSARKYASDLRVTAQLIKADEETVLWAETQDGTMENVFEIQEHVANRIVNALKLRLTPNERKSLRKRSTENTEAFQLYMKGRFFWNKRTRESLQTAVRYFEQAIEKDPQYAPAWAGIADSYNLLTEHSVDTRRELYSKAIAAARKALEYDDRLAEAHASLGLLLMLTEWDWRSSEKEYLAAIRLNPNYATAHHWYAEWLCFQGRFEEAVAEVSLAEKLNPLSPAILNDGGMIQYYARRYDDAIDSAHKTLEVDHDFILAHRLLSLAYQGKGMFKESLEEHQRWTETGGGGSDAAAILAQCYAAAGKQMEAGELLSSAERQPITTGNSCRGIALAHATLRNIDQAFAWLEKAFALRAESLCMLKVDPKLDPLRDDPRFASLLRRTGLGT
jgi:serine/threonine protein kinase